MVNLNAQDTENYAPFGITRSDAGDNLAYLGMTRQNQISWEIGINSSNDFIIGVGADYRSIPTPLFHLTENGTLSLSDTNINLYKGGTGTLRTDSIFRCNGLATGTFNVSIGNGANNAILIVDKIELDTNAHDITIERISAGILKVTGAVEVTGDIIADGKLQALSSVITDRNAGIYWHSNTNYAIFRESGAWAAPYPRLMIDWSTGIQIAATPGYKGIELYSDTIRISGNATISGDLTVNGKSTINGDCHIGGNLTVTGTYPGGTIGGGVTKLSELEIDADKDWLTWSITDMNTLQLNNALIMGSGYGTMSIQGQLEPLYSNEVYLGTTGKPFSTIVGSNIITSTIILNLANHNVKLEYYGAALPATGWSPNPTANVCLRTPNAFFCDGGLLVGENAAFHGDVRPYHTDTFVLGDDSYKWKYIRGTTITPGDLKFENGMIMTEAEKYGFTGGIAILNTKKEVIMHIDEDGNLAIKGTIGRLQ